MSYPDLPNPDLLDRIPLDAARVLDVGCGAGALGACYRRRNPAARIYGIEADPAAAAIAATRLHQVSGTDVEREPLPFGQTQFDCIVYGDVLEHMRDPWRLLSIQMAALAPGGVVLICVPNAEHWSFAERLLRGTFDYDEQGLFDRTHLRWLTLDTTRRGLHEAGLLAYDVKPRIFDAAEAGRFARAIAPSLEVLGIDPAHYLQRATPLQYVWRAARTLPVNLHVVSTMLAPVGGVSEVRVTEPMSALATELGIQVHLAHDFAPLALPPGAPRIFIFHRPVLAGEQGLGFVRALLAQDYIVLCEFDDHPDYIPVLQRDDIQNFRAVHAVQTSTEPLANLFRRQNPEVMVFPNAIRELPELRNYADPERITLFFGGLNREADWPAMMPALNAVAAAMGERLHFRVVNDRGFYDALATPHKSFTPLCDYTTYLDLLGSSEISFMPLTDTVFNRCKSDLKFLEAAAARVTALASPVVYEGTVEDGRTALLFRTPDELQHRLMQLVTDPAHGRGIADAARSYVIRHRMLAYQVSRRVAWYRSLWERRDELRQALLARVPELAEPSMREPA